jgi:RNHCP domain
MEPVGIDYRPAKGFLVVHHCLDCGCIRRNRVSDDDMEAVISLMQALAEGPQWRA